MASAIISKLIYSPGDFIIRKGKFGKISVLGTIFAPKTEIVHRYLRTIKKYPRQKSPCSFFVSSSKLIQPDMGAL